MAKSYKELVTEVTKRRASNAADLASSVVDSVIYAPAKAAESIQKLKETMTSKAEVVATVIEAKLMLEDKMLDQVEAADFAYRLSQDENLRKTMTQLTQQILQPTPVESEPAQKSNSYVNIGAGLSAFWAEMQKKLPIEIETAAEIENIIMNVNAGMDSDLEPDTRKLFLKEAGMTAGQVNELVPLSEYVNYEEKLRNVIRSEVMLELGLDGDRELTEEEQLLVDSLMEDRIMGNKSQVDMSDVPADYTPTYEDMYGISSEDMQKLFGGPNRPEIPENMEIPKEYWDILNATVAENMEMLAELETSKEFLQYQEPPKVFGPEDEAFAQGISEADMAFAEQMGHEDDGFVMGISEADMALAEQMAFEGMDQS